MKKLIVITLLTLTSVCSYLAADDDNNLREMIEKKKEFITMEKGHMNDWFDYGKKLLDMKLDLIKNHHNEHASHHIAWLNKIQDQGFNTRSIRQGLTEAIALHEQQKDDWKRLHQLSNAKARRIYEKNKAELQEFKKSLVKSLREMESED